MRFTETPFAGLWVIESPVFSDERGYFMETYHQGKFFANGIRVEFLQHNHSCSKRGVIRGLHFQKPPFEQGKLVRVVKGTVFDVAVDIRRDSPSFGKWFGEQLSAENRRMLYIPPGFAHGFQALSEEAELSYSCTALYSQAHEDGVLWNDPELKIPWSDEVPPLLSEKDRLLPPLSRLRRDE